MRAIADAQLVLDVDAGGFERRHLLEQRRQIDHHAVADHRLHARAQNAARDQLEHELLLPDEDGVAGVVPALIARHDVEALGKQIDHFAFAFVAPLRAENDDIAHPQTIVATQCCRSAIIGASRENSGNELSMPRRLRLL